MFTTSCFLAEQCEGLVVVTPTKDLGDFDYAQIEHDADELMLFLDSIKAVNVIIDLGKSRYVGSSFLGVVARTCEAAHANDGRVAICHADENEATVLRLTKLDTIAHICRSRTDAMEYFETHN